MTDFDPDAYLQQTDSAPAFDPDAYLSQPPAAPTAAAPASHPAAARSSVVRRNPNMGAISTAGNDASVADLTQAGVSGVNSGAMDLLGIPMDAAANVVDLGKAAAGTIYHSVTGNDIPRALQIGDRALVPGSSEWLKAQSRRVFGANTVDVQNNSTQDLSALHTAGEVAGPGAVADVAARAPEAVTSVVRSKPSPAQAVQNTQAALDRAAASSPQSMGAAASAPQISSASPVLQQVIGNAVQKGPVNMDAITNHWEADQHGVQLMEGQATRDPIQFSNEQNSTHKDVVKRINVQNQQLTDAIDNVRREAAPGAVQNNPIENGQTAVDGLKAYDEPIKADIRAKYDAAKAASASGDLQMDGSSFVSDANSALRPQSKFRFLPPTVQGILDDVANANGKMNLDDYQAYNTQLSAEARKAKRADDGNAIAAISKVQDALNNIKPVGQETTQAKALFDTARSAAKARFDELRADPAYRAAVDDASDGVPKGEPSTLADKFLDKYALQAPKANVDRLMGKLDPESQQAVTAHTLSTIRHSAVTANGFVSPNGFNSAMEKYGPKLESLVSPETRESLDSLGRVITNAKVPPPGHLVNYSKSGVLSNAAHGASNIVQGGAEALVNAKTFGLGVPIVKGIAEGNWAKRTLAPGAGITKPSPLVVP